MNEPPFQDRETPCWTSSLPFSSSWPLSALEPSVDRPIFRWVAARQEDGWTDVWREVTMMGNSSVTRPLALVAGVVIALLWFTRGMRWWVPLLTFPVGYAMEAFGQVMLKLTVHRGHPPTDRGTYPSGGCARVVVVYGLIIVLLLLWRHRPVSVSAWAAGISVTLLATSIEGYARVYNQEHWFTDVIGGIVFGFLTLGASVTLVFVLTRDRSGARPSVGHEGVSSDQAIDART